ncbi:hypothetical protein RhiirC2_754319, partial [Rhizophagus irregularis]
MRNVKHYQTCLKLLNSDHWFRKYFKLSENWQSGWIRRNPVQTADLIRINPDQSVHGSKH